MAHTRNSTAVLRDPTWINATGLSRPPFVNFGCVSVSNPSATMGLGRSPLAWR
jgi:hypothetical protein